MVVFGGFWWFLVVFLVSSGCPEMGKVAPDGLRLPWRRLRARTAGSGKKETAGAAAGLPREAPGQLRAALVGRVAPWRASPKVLHRFYLAGQPQNRPVPHILSVLLFVRAGYIYSQAA